MNERTLKTLEFDKILDALVEACGSSAGKGLAAALRPVSDREIIEKWQEETQAAYSRVCQKGSISFSGIPEIGGMLERVRVGSVLGMGELRRVGNLLSATLRIKQYGENGDNSEDVLSERFSLLAPHEAIAREINRCIISEEEMADDASRELFSIRKSLKAKKAQISDKIAEIAKEAAEGEQLRDNLVTQRDGRYVIPVKAEFKNKVPGLVHDRSSSKNTFFIEPMAIVNLNNEIRELEGRESEEIERILEELSLSLTPIIPDLEYNLKTLRELDFIFAKAMLAKKMRACRPKFSNNLSVTLKKARHPLIHEKQVVPIDIRLGSDFHLLVITGPNTGGKTVSLKTMGLFHLMGQAGLHIPAMEGSVLAVFGDIFADIGDEQSIEQSLSTFSSHMTRTVDILNGAKRDSLVLFDELGAGTDPVEGAALAMAILNSLSSKKIRTMATTHYSELKAYALTTPGVINGSCEFDVETLRPTYRLIIGTPGKSNAFAISRRLGLSEDILSHAEGMVGQADRDFDEILGELESLRMEAEEARAVAAAEREEAKRLLDLNKEEKKKLAERKEREIARAKEEAQEILSDAKEYADEAIRKLNKLGKNSNLSAMENERRSLRKKVDEHTVKQKEVKPSKIHKASDFHIGDTVKILSMGVTGTIHTLPNKKNECTVNIGIMTYQCPITDMEIMPDEVKLPEKLKKTGEGKIRMEKALMVSPEINLVGKYPDEAVAELEKYLDDAYISGLPKVTVIHGRGTGALRAAVHGYLKRVRFVERFRIGEFGEGDAGVTIVEFKDK